ncbi:uncharacterized protein At4g19900 [Impatiens glandulifera]|uniref:uncharacterized protein At4g19900 n=1 Tax=Impatiens glandulifera TaxID=253017 RepID=UPI001FB061B7|nr:uncharacterized protein At4g19900 [Impatiens glandulifera]
MLRNLRSRRRSRYVVQACSFIAAILLLLSVALLHSRLGSHRDSQNRIQLHSNDVVSDPLLDDADLDDARTRTNSDDRIDELDDVQDDNTDHSRVPDEEEILRGVESEEEEAVDQSKLSGYYFDHIYGVIRRSFDRRSIDQWEDYQSFDPTAGFEDRSKVAFGSDDLPVDENVRKKMADIKGIEDALLLKTGSDVSPLREGWGPWFEAKSDFLRKDKMFKSSLEILNPLNNPLLQDPDGAGLTTLTRGDRIVQKLLLNNLKKAPTKKPLGIEGLGINEEDVQKLVINKSSSRSEIKRAERRTLDVGGAQMNNNSKVIEATQSKIAPVFARGSDTSASDQGGLAAQKNVASRIKNSSSSVEVYADGKRWGYFSGLHPHLSFSNFMEAFFRKGKCSLRVFMIWNSAPWMFSVRHQRSLESLLFHHRDACVVVFSETIELNFFQGFVDDGFKVAVVMPNLDELLKNTPTHVFASVWFEWRKTKFYSTHYSELVRLAALYKYGGVYLDSDVIVLRPLSSFVNTVGLEDDGTSLNGAVMSFRRHSPFIRKCLIEFYSTYDETRLRWNGADLLTRVAGNFSTKGTHIVDNKELKLQPALSFFPISHGDISRFFLKAATEAERADEDEVFRNILEKSFTFHFWNSFTSSLVPDPGSLAARLINHPCIRCLDVL